LMSRAVATMSAPASAKTSHILAPSPFDAPVTRAVLPAREKRPAQSPITLSLRCRVHGSPTRADGPSVVRLGGHALNRYQESAAARQQSNAASRSPPRPAPAR